jgi:hypothetical protein
MSRSSPYYSISLPWHSVISRSIYPEMSLTSPVAARPKRAAWYNVQLRFNELSTGRFFMFTVTQQPPPPPPPWARGSSFTRFLDHTQRRTTVGRTPLYEWSSRRTDFYLTTHNTHNKHPCPLRNRTRNPSNPAAADPRLRTRGHWDWPKCFLVSQKFNMGILAEVYVRCFGWFKCRNVIHKWGAVNQINSDTLTHHHT